MPMKPRKEGEDEAEDEDEDEEGVEVESAEAAAELLGEGDVVDIVPVGLVDRVAPLHHG